MGEGVQFRALGPVEAIDSHGDPVALGGRRQRSILALLLINANHVVSVDRMVEALWPDAAPPKGTAAVHVGISRLRRALETDRPPRAAPSLLISRPGGYLLQLDRGSFDVTCLEDLVHEAREIEHRDPVRAYDLLQSALDLWRGPPYQEFVYDGFAAMEIARLQECAVAAEEDRFEIGMTLGRHAELIPRLEIVASEHRLRERVHGQLMLALYRSGRQAEALAAYQRLRRTLDEELGLEPSRELQRLEGAILRQEARLEVLRDQPMDSAPARERPDVGLVGRDLDLRRLREVFHGAANGRGRVVLVEGEAGIGKSFLIEAFLSAAVRARPDALILEGRCSEDGTAAPFWPWVQVLRGLVDEIGFSSVTAAAAHQLPALSGLLAELPPDIIGSVEPAQVRQVRVCSAITSVLTATAHERPTVVALDDVHCGDEASLRAVVAVAHEVRRTPIVLLLAYRPDAVSGRHPMIAALADLQRATTVERLQLDRLEAPDVEALISGVTGAVPSPAVVSAVFDRTSGNPFFTVELARLLAQADSLHEPDGDRARTAIPVGVKEVLRARLSVLSRPAYDLLAAGAVFGRNFDLSVVADACAIGETEALDHIEEARRAGLVVDSDQPGSVRFSHVLIQEALVHQLGREREAALHRRIAEGLARHAPGDLFHALQLAHHAEAASAAADGEWRSVMLRRAAQLAATGLAFDHADRLHIAQLDAARAIPPSAERSRLELEALVDLSVVRTWIRGYHSAEVGETVTEALALAPMAGRAVSVLTALYARWSHHCLRAEFNRADEVAIELERLAQRHPDPVVVFTSGLVSAIGAWGRGQITVANERLRAIEPQLPDVSDPNLSRVCIAAPPVIFGSFFALTRTLAGDAEQGTRLAEQSLLYSRSIGHSWSHTLALVIGQAMVAAMAGDPALAAAASEEGIARATEHGFVSLIPLGGAILAWSRAMSTGSAEHAASARAAADELQAGGAPAFRHFLLGLVAEAYLATGDASAALAAANEAAAEAARVGEFFWLPEVHQVRGESLVRRGQGDLAALAFTEAITSAEEQGVTLADRAGLRGSVERLRTDTSLRDRAASADDRARPRPVASPPGDRRAAHRMP